MHTIPHVIDGVHTQGCGEHTAKVYDPARGEVVAEVGLGSPADADDAVAAARRAFPGWSDLSLTRRQRLLFDFRAELDRHVDDLAQLITREHGKVLDDARGEVRRGLEVLDFACGIPHLLKGGFSQNVSNGVDAFSIREPVGVTVGITPFNFPVMVPMWMLAVSIACGNTFVLKPSERDPSPSVLLADLAIKAGMPEGVLNVVHGDREVVTALLEHDDVDAVSFVGSTPVARSVYETASRAGKRVQALGGAKNHLVVLPDADLDLVADELVSAAYGSAGERCMAISVGVAVGDVGDALRDRVRERAEALTVADGRDPDADMGPLVTAAHRDRVRGYVDRVADDGAELVVDGRDVAVDDREDGFFLGPCLVDHVQPHMEIYTDEVFGPVLSLVRVDTLEDAIDLVNANPYGNGVSLFTASGQAARTFQKHIKVGMVGINIPIPVPVGFYSFGGWKDSLFGDTHVYGPEGVDFYTRTKAVTSRWPTTTAGVDMGFLTRP